LTPAALTSFPVGAAQLRVAEQRFDRSAFDSANVSATDTGQVTGKRNSDGHPVNTVAWQAALSRLSGSPISHADIGKTFRKYGFTTPERQTAFLSQSYIETGLLRFTKEVGSGAPNPLLPATQYYTVFYGRGLMQLTWPTLYADYGTFRKFPNNTSGTYVDLRITATSTHHWSGGPTVDHQGHVHSDMRQW
jgi:hypothetical protein